jgi:hypothetical protein
MDNMETLVVRFHFGGAIFFDGKRMHYLGGSEELSYIEWDKTLTVDKTQNFDLE